MTPLLVLRPEPGNYITVNRARDLGLAPVSCPLFAIEPVSWTAPDTSGVDYILFTSANALRHGGGQIARLTDRPALAVGPVTADAARAAGFDVTMTGDEGVDALLAGLPGARQLLHPGGAEHRAVETRHRVETVVVYRSITLPAPVVPAGKLVALVHSPRAGARFAQLALDRARIAIAAISAPAAAECGAGWATVETAGQPSDGALLALAARLCQD